MTHAEAEGTDWKSIKLDASKTIASIGFKIPKEAEIPQIHGIKVYSDDFEEMANVIWDTQKTDAELKGDWVYQ